MKHITVHGNETLYCLTCGDAIIDDTAYLFDVADDECVAFCKACIVMHPEEQVAKLGTLRDLVNDTSKSMGFIQEMLYLKLAKKDGCSVEEVKRRIHAELFKDEFKEL